MVICREGILNGIHFLSHASEILSNNFEIHSHGHGHFHVHHHDFMDSIKSIFDRENTKSNNHDKAHISITHHAKYHLPVVFLINFSFSVENLDRKGFSKELNSIFLDVLTPPPRIHA